MKRFLPYGFVAAAVAALMLVSQFIAPNAEAQAGASCPISAMAPVETTSTSIAPTANDMCKTYITTSSSAITVTLPAINTVPSGWYIWVKAQGSGTATVTPTTALSLDGLSTSVALTTGKSGMFQSNHTSYYSLGLGIAHP
jgi:hypothetical protein